MQRTAFNILLLLAISIFTFACSGNLVAGLTPTPTLALTHTPKPTSTVTSTRTPLPKTIFDSFPTPLSGADFGPYSLPDSIKTSFGIILPGTIVEEPVVIDSTIGQVSFRLFWQEGDLDLTLIEPDGKIYTDPFYTGGGFYYMYPEQDGQWTMRIFAKSAPSSGTNYMIQVNGMTATGAYFNFDKPEYLVGEDIKLAGYITDGVSGSLRTPPEYIYGVSMEVIAEDPEKNQYHFVLYDDGLHEDGKVNDGIYANIFQNTKVAGKYNFHIKLSGLNNRDKQPFTRELFYSAVVH